ncbi:MAG: ribosome biogenesis GTPase Der, partial [Sulfurovaceae bacterium]
NVGKSSLFNRLAKQRDAITSDVSGTTRDVKKRVVTISEDREFQVIDTGGIDAASGALFSKVAELSLRAAQSADVILYLVDGKMIPDDEDKKLFYKLQALGIPIALIINKIDNDKEEQTRFWEFSSFGAKDIFAISVSHNRKLNPFYKWLERYIPPKEQGLLATAINEEFDPLYDEPKSEMIEDDNEIRVAIIGRVNTGKSSLLNALLKEERSVVSEVDGTTIDPIDETIEYDEHMITFIDTAGIRRRSKILGIEKYALTRTTAMLEKADIVLLMIDASAGVSELDERVAGLIEKHKLACLIVLNKWDIKGDNSYEAATQDIRDELKFLHYAPLITISAKTGLR